MMRSMMTTMMMMTMMMTILMMSMMMMVMMMMETDCPPGDIVPEKAAAAVEHFPLPSNEIFKR